MDTAESETQCTRGNSKRENREGEGEQLDVTELYYSRKALHEENASLEETVAKLESEISRMRTHIEKESDRVAKAIEAARTNIQNNIEPGVK